MLIKRESMTKSSFINTIVNVLNLTKTDVEILKILITLKSGLLISEISKLIKRSERNVRKRINILIERGLLRKKMEVLENKRLAYRYSIESEKKILEGAKKHLTEKINELNKLIPMISSEHQTC
jgi:predicted transcriptional regulator